MKRLILMRHAKSSWDHPDLDDFERPLNERGQRDVLKSAMRLEAFLDGALPVIEASPAVRARATTECIAERLQVNAEHITWNPELYLCSPDDWLACIQAWSDEVATVMTVGHNPGITTLLNRLAMQQVDNVPTSGIAAIDFEMDSWSQVAWGLGKLIWFDYPKLHGSR